MIEFIATITSRLGASFCIGLLCGVPIAALTGSGFWASVGVIAMAFFAFAPVDQ